MNTEKNWGAEPWREPKMQDTDVLKRSECGRIVFNIDYRSHWFVLVKGQFGGHALLVKHGGGEERIQMPMCNDGQLARIIASLNSDDAYLLMHHLFDIHKDARRAGESATATEYRHAFVDGRLKKRKHPAKGVVKVWIEPKTETVAA